MVFNKSFVMRLVSLVTWLFYYSFFLFLLCAQLAEADREVAASLFVTLLQTYYSSFLMSLKGFILIWCFF